MTILLQYYQHSVISCHILLSPVTSCYLLSHLVTSFYLCPLLSTVTSCHIVSSVFSWYLQACHFNSCYILSFSVTSCPILTRITFWNLLLPTDTCKVTSCRSPIVTDGWPGHCHHVMDEKTNSPTKFVDNEFNFR